jgi:hypothetical protein
MRICIPVHPVLAGIDRLRIDEWRYIVKDTDIIAAIAPDAVSLMDKAIAEIKRLRQENATLTAERDEMQGELRKAETESSMLRVECGVIAAERDEARRLLKAVVDMMRDNMVHDATHPHHLCDFIHRPDIAMCKVCENWTDALVMCYPDDFQDEEDKP